MILFDFSQSGFGGQGWAYSISIDSDKILKQRIKIWSDKLQGKPYKDFEIKLSNFQYLKLYKLISNIDFKAAEQLDNLILMCDVGSYQLRVKAKDGEEKSLYVLETYPSIPTERLASEHQKKQFMDNVYCLPEDFNLDNSIEACNAFGIFLDYINNLLPVEDSLTTTRNFFRKKPEKFWISYTVRNQKDISKIYLKLKKILRPYGLEYTVEKQRAEGKLYWEIGEVTSLVAYSIKEKCTEAGISIEVSEID